jgi:hypothetical protein
LEPAEVFAKYRQEWSHSAPSNKGLGRFLLITITKAERAFDGTVFETPDGTRFILLTASTRKQADAQAAAVGSETRVFAVRPYWSMPAAQWVAADPDFWQPNRRINQQS